MGQRQSTGALATTLSGGEPARVGAENDAKSQGNAGFFNSISTKRYVLEAQRFPPAFFIRVSREERRDVAGEREMRTQQFSAFHQCHQRRRKGGNNGGTGFCGRLARPVIL
jgi:hypothetical protein